MTLATDLREALLSALEARFKKHVRRHPEIAWDDVRARLEAHPDKLRSLYEMEQTHGEPDVVAQDLVTGEYIFYDCSAESPAGRRSLCFDHAAQTSRKTAAPAGNVLDMAAAIGIELLSEVEYRYLQTLGEFDTRTSSWVQTPPAIRRLGGALFCDRRYDTVFVYHNGAGSYYASRGFRGSLRV